MEIKYQLYASFLPKIAKGLTNKAAGAEICELVLMDCMHIKSFPLFLDILASLIELIFRFTSDVTTYCLGPSLGTRNNNSFSKFFKNTMIYSYLWRRIAFPTMLARMSLQNCINLSSSNNFFDN